MKKIIFLGLIVFSPFLLSAQKTLRAEAHYYWSDQSQLTYDSFNYFHSSHISFYDKQMETFSMSPDSMQSYLSSDQYERVYQYNGYGNVVSGISREKSGSQFVNKVRVLYSYDTLQQVILIENQVWDEDDQDWFTVKEETRTYDASGNQLSITVLTYNNLFLENSQRRLWTYDTAARVKSRIIQSWVNGEWIDMFQDLYDYSIDGKLIRFTYREPMDFNGKELFTTDSIIYTGNSDTTSELEFRFDFVLNQLKPLQHRFYYWNNDSTKSGDQIYNWNNGNWNYIGRSSYSYDTSKRLLESITYDSSDKFLEKHVLAYNSYSNLGSDQTWKWDKLQQKWLPSGMKENIYDAYGDLLEYSEKDWNGTAWVQSHKAAERRVYYYIPGSSLPKGKSIHTLLLYPNPARNILNIQSPVKADMILITDMNGREILKLPAENEASDLQLDLSNLPAGIYNVQLRKGGMFIGMARFIKLSE